MARLDTLLMGRVGFEKKTMFGGVGYLLNGNMCVGAWKEFLIARVGPVAYAAALAKRGAREFDITGRPMTGWVMVESSALRAVRDLEAWVGAAMRFVDSLPSK